MTQPVSGSADQHQHETYNPWTVVNLVFHHLAGQGLHPVLGEAGDPGEHAAGLLRAFGIVPAAEGNQQLARNIRTELEQLRNSFFPDH